MPAESPSLNINMRSSFSRKKGTSRIRVKRNSMFFFSFLPFQKYLERYINFHWRLSRYLSIILARIYLFNFTMKTPEQLVKSVKKITIKTPKRHQWRLSGVFIVNFEQILHIVLLFHFLTLNKCMSAGIIHYVNAKSGNKK